MLLKEIDYLSEDPELPGQKYALVSIVGPHMPQKCDIWGLKIRGVADSLEKSKKMSEKLLRVDSDYDIYTVEIGKFFPLVVEPNEIADVEYQNEALNQLIKGYLQNKELANEHWHERKRELIKQAIQDGKNQDELNAKVEHPVAVLNRIKTYETQMKNLEEQIKTLQQDLQMSKNKFEKVYTDEEKRVAMEELNSELKNILPESSEKSLKEIRESLTNSRESSSSSKESSSSSKKSSTNSRESLARLYELEKEMEYNPSEHLRLEFEQLKLKLPVEELNEYINSKFQESPYNNL